MTCRRVRSAALATAGMLLLAGCSAAGASGGGGGASWVPQPDHQTNNDPIPSPPGLALPGPQPTAPGTPGSGGSSPGSTPGSSGGASPSPSPASSDPVVAKHLDQPTGLVVLPDGTALVGERNTGRILRVQPVAGKPVTVEQTLAVNGSGDGGLLDLALSPTYSQDGLVYAYLSTATDNRVVHFALGSAPSAVITGIPHGTRDNAGRIAFDATGALLTGTGDAGQPELAQSPTSLAGKILRTDDIGAPAADNPDSSSRVYAAGFRTVDGLCVQAQDGTRIAISAGFAGSGQSHDEIDIIKSGADYGWPDVAPAGATAPPTAPVASLPVAGGAGCAVGNGQLAVATVDGQSLVLAKLSNGVVSEETVSLKGTYGRLRTVVAAADGAVWLTTANRDGHGKPIADDDRVIRLPNGGAATQSTL